MKKKSFRLRGKCGRSQVAEAFARRYGRGKVEVFSTGTMPLGSVNSPVVQAMQEKGIDLSSNKPKLISGDLLRDADRVIVMGCAAQGFCPAPLLEEVGDWGIEDPKGKPLGKVREIRDEIKRRVKKLRV